MKSNIVVSLAAVLAVALFCSLAYAHVPPELTYLAVGIPDDQVPTIDGRFNDWPSADALEPYTIDRNNPYPAGAAPGLIELRTGVMPSADDSDFFLTFGWNGTTNKLYLQLIVIDDVRHNGEQPSQNHDDGFTISLDPSHTGQMFSAFPAEQDTIFRGRFAQEWIFTEYEGPNFFEGPNGPRRLFNWGYGRWDQLPPYAEMAHTEDPPRYNFEIAWTLFDELDQIGGEISGPPGNSILHQLAENQIIGVAFQVNDDDGHAAGSPETWRKDASHPDNTDGSYGSPTGADDWKDASQFGDLLLTPVDPAVWATAVESNTWGRIKASFK